uniref:Uncharacterized protein n=1 Tax=Glossina pallidipes TaxID=7398 RepID=A0A1B0AEE6_GLOPL
MSTSLLSILIICSSHCSTKTTENTNNKTEHNTALERSTNRGSTVSSVSPIYHEAAATAVKRQLSSAKITSAKFDKILRDSETSDHNSLDFYRPIAVLICSNFDYIVLKKTITSSAEISILPVNKVRNYEHSSNVILIAANGSPVPIFDKKLLNVNLGLRREFAFAFTVVSLSNPIIGADVLCKYGLPIDVKHKRSIDLLISF